MTLEELNNTVTSLIEQGYNEYDIRFIGRNSQGADVDGVEVDSERGSIYLVEGF